MTPLKHARVTRGWSQELLAEKAGLPQPTISRAERSGSATAGVAIKIARALDSTVEQLFAEVQEDRDGEQRDESQHEAAPRCGLVPDLGTADTIPPTEAA